MSPAVDQLEAVHALHNGSELGQRTGARPRTPVVGLRRVQSRSRDPFPWKFVAVGVGFDRASPIGEVRPVRADVVERQGCADE